MFALLSFIWKILSIVEIVPASTLPHVWTSSNFFKRCLFFPSQYTNSTIKSSSIISSLIKNRQKYSWMASGGSCFYLLCLHSLLMSVCDLQGAMSVDSITDLDDNQSRLLEALQLSLPAEAQSKKEKARDKKLSLNPIYRQVPRLVDSCCQHLEKHGKQAYPSVLKTFINSGIIYLSTQFNSVFI